MAEDVAHIVIVSPNAAFGAFAESVLSSWPDIAVHALPDTAELAHAPYHPAVIACNFEFDSGFYQHFAAMVRGFRLRHPVATMAIVRHLDGWTRARCREAGIDEVVIKPISPLHLGLRLATLTTGYNPAPARHSAEILPFPTRRRIHQAKGFHPFAS